MQPNQNPNNQPQPANPNLQPGLSPEQPLQPIPERQTAPAAPEMAPTAPGGASQSQPIQVPQVPQMPAAPVSPVPVSPAAAPTMPPSVGPAPTVANDVDVIEKEWVDQADKVIEQTKEDPYVEEEAVEALQQDYLKKRYNHDVKKPDGQ